VKRQRGDECLIAKPLSGVGASHLWSCKGESAFRPEIVALIGPWREKRGLYEKDLGNPSGFFRAGPLQIEK